MKTVGIVACSDAQKEEYRGQNDELLEYLKSIGCKVIVSNCIYEKNGSFSGTGKERAAELMKFFSDPAIDDIYDLSGGDIANQVLDELDYDVICESRATFWGYSDLTTVINAVYTLTGKSSVLYQVKNLAWEEKAPQRRRFETKEGLFCPDFRFIRGESMEGIVIGGNIRCFLKLAGTRYFPDVRDKVLLLESYGGEVPQMITYLSQLKQLGVFDQVSGILLGTFTRMEAKKCQPDIITLVQEFAGEHVPIAHTAEIGHGKESKAIRIGERIRISDQ
ncbi:MAG: LD-carboxypeptidase [Clostridiaceae bacterium]|nr:LD-carboxypeptidase [Clostridiaceae bacterium]